VKYILPATALAAIVGFFCGAAVNDLSISSFDRALTAQFDLSEAAPFIRLYDSTVGIIQFDNTAFASEESVLRTKVALSALAPKVLENKVLAEVLSTLAESGYAEEKRSVCVSAIGVLLEMDLNRRGATMALTYSPSGSQHRIWNLRE
jgi:hypothetical protein